MPSPTTLNAPSTNQDGKTLFAVGSIELQIKLPAGYIELAPDQRDPIPDASMKAVFGLPTYAQEMQQILEGWEQVPLYTDSDGPTLQDFYDTINAELQDFNAVIRAGQSPAAVGALQDPDPTEFYYVWNGTEWECIPILPVALLETSGAELWQLDPVNTGQPYVAAVFRYHRVS